MAMIDAWTTNLSRPAPQCKWPWLMHRLPTCQEQRPNVNGYDWCIDNLSKPAPQCKRLWMMHAFQLKIAYGLRARKDFLILIEKNMTIRFAGFIGARNEFFQKMMSVMWLQRRDVTWVFRGARHTWCGCCPVMWLKSCSCMICYAIYK